MSKLVMAKKPSVAKNIADVLGANKKEDGFLEGGGYVVSWCVGHLIEFKQPEAMMKHLRNGATNRYPLSM